MHRAEYRARVSKSLQVARECCRCIFEIPTVQSTDSFRDEGALMIYHLRL